MIVLNGLSLVQTAWVGQLLNFFEGEFTFYDHVHAFNPDYTAVE